MYYGVSSQIRDIPFSFSFSLLCIGIMKYIDALKKYNEGKDKWCTPRKGTEDYLKIRMMMKMKSAASASSSSSKSSIARPKDKLELLNVSGRNNNCFFNSIYLFIKDINDFKSLKSGTDLRRYLCDIFLQPQNLKKTIRKFTTYLELVKAYCNDGMSVEGIAELLSVNVAEIKSLKAANIKKFDLNKQGVIETLLHKHFKVSGRMPSQPEMFLAIDYIKRNYNIVVVPIILNHTTMNISLRHEMIGKIRRRIDEKLANAAKTSGSSGLRHSAAKYKYGVIITDNTHYQMLKINNRVLSTNAELSNFIMSQDNSFSFRNTDVRSRS